MHIVGRVYFYKKGDMKMLLFLGLVIFNVIITIMISYWMNKIAADMLLECYYEDKLKTEKRLLTLEYKQQLR